MHGTPLVALDADHPGFRDPAYRRRRDAIARAATLHRPGQPVPPIAYTDAEQAVWREVGDRLGPLHATWAHPVLRAHLDQLDLFAGDVPQLEALNRALQATGFRMAPVAGLVTPRDFLEALASGAFLATQYLRHPSRPRYTPEPDVVHEIVGHVPCLLHPGLAALHRSFGAAARTATDDGVERLIRVYWWTLEFGLVLEGEDMFALGAGLLSSAGELAGIASGPEWRDLDAEAMANTPFDPTAMNPVLFVAPGLAALLDHLTEWLAGE